MEIDGLDIFVALLILKLDTIEIFLQEVVESLSTSIKSKY